MPHSEIPGSPIARISPGLFAACHVLHRLSVPRHPPDALQLLDPKHREHARWRYHDTPDPAAHRGKPQMPARPPVQPVLPARSAAEPARVLLRARRLVHEDTFSDGPITRHFMPQAEPSASVTFTNSLHPINQHPPDTRPQRGQPRPMRHTRENRSSPNAMGSEVRSQTPDPFQSLIAPISDLCRRISGGERDRTDDLLLAKQALSQLSYTPVSGIRNLLSDPRCLIPGWWAREDLNLRPHAYQARALTS